MKLTDLQVRVNRYPDAPTNLPDRCVLVTNSSRRTAHCPRRYLLAEIEGLKPVRTRMPLSFGRHWHSIKEVVHRAWMEDRRPSQQEIDEALAGVRTVSKQEVTDGLMEASDAVDMVDRLESSLRAWLVRTAGAQPPVSYRVVGAELSLAMPICSASGRPYAPRTLLVQDRGTGLYRLAGPGDADQIQVRWPWYFLGRLDLLFQHRHTGVLWVGDDKSSKQGAQLISRTTQDPQVPSYLALVRYAVREGLLEHLGIGRDTPVMGFWHRVTSSAGYKPPKELTSRKKSEAGVVVGLSQDKRQRCPSWDYRRRLRELGLDESEYDDVIQHLRRNVDENIEQHAQTNYSGEDLDRWERELLADAKRLSHLWRSAARARSLHDLDATHPRIPVCQSQMYQCDYVGPCMRDGEEVRRDFDARYSQTWAPADSSESVVEQTAQINPNDDDQPDFDW